MTAFAPLSSIEIPENRQRRRFDVGELNELRESIEAIGLLHPIIVRREGERLLLVAGERRLRAVTDLYDLGGVLTFGEGETGVRGTAPHGQIPYLTLGELTPIQAMEAEFEENVRRVDLSWQEKAAATSALAKLRQAQAAARSEPPPTLVAIADEVRGGASEALGLTKMELALAQRLDDPDIAAATTLKEAFKIAKRKDVAAVNERLGAALGAGQLAAGHELVIGDCVEWMRGQLGETFDVILTDPPYGMGADEFGDSGGKTAGAHFYEDSHESWMLLMGGKTWSDERGWQKTADGWCGLAFRVAKPEAHAYVFCDFEKFPTLKALMEDAGWRVFRTPLIWHKPGAFRAPWPEHGPQRKYECCLFAVKGDRKVMALLGDVITCAPDQNLGHQAQKPVALYQDLLKRSVRPGDKVLDTFCGTGPIFPAAHSLKCFAVGVERDQAAAGIAAKRLQELKGN